MAPAQVRPARAPWVVHLRGVSGPLPTGPRWTRSAGGVQGFGCIRPKARSPPSWSPRTPPAADTASSRGFWMTCRSRLAPGLSSVAVAGGFGRVVVTPQAARAAARVGAPIGQSCCLLGPGGHCVHLPTLGGLMGRPAWGPGGGRGFWVLWLLYHHGGQGHRVRDRDGRCAVAGPDSLISGPLARPLSLERWVL